MIAWTFVACAPPAGSARAEVTARLASTVAVGHWGAFERRSAVLAERAQEVCAAPSASGWEAAREAWWEAREPWKHGELVQFGPIVEYPDRLGPKLDDWPADVGAVEELLASDAPLDPEAFAAMGSATRGLPVVEVLLWSGEDPLAAAVADPRRCEALVGATADVHANAARLLESWTGEWVPRLVAPSPWSGGPWDGTREVLDEWANRAVFAVEDVRGTRLGRPLGDASGGAPVPEALESRWSGRSLQDARDVLDGVREVWDGPGLRSLVADEGLRAEVDALFATSAERLAEVPEPLEQAIAEEPEIVVRAQEALFALQVALQVEVAQALGVTVTFNDNDGD